MERIKYPKTLHLPWSEGLQNDDRLLDDINCFSGKDVIITEKMDGENFVISRDFCHARSLTDGALTPKQGWSREWIKNLWGIIRYEMPDDIRIHGENLYAEHSIKYYNLPSYFFVFGISDNDKFLSWDDVIEWCSLLNLEHVPVIFDGQWDEDMVKNLWPFNSQFADMPEGYVVRVRDGFLINDFPTNTAKFVRKNHIQSDETWFKGEWLRNRIRKVI